MIKALLVLLALLLPTAANAQELAVGDDAPELNLETWIQGEAPQAKIQLWVSWSVKSWEAIEALSALELLQQAYGEEIAVTVVAAEPEEEVRRFLEETELLSLMKIGIAVDTSASFQEKLVIPTKETRVPTLFIFGPSGRIEAIGDPRELAFSIEMMLEGSWDPYVFEAFRHNVIQLEYQRQRALAQGASGEEQLEIVDALLEVHAAAPNYGDPSPFQLHRFQLLASVVNDETRAYSYVRALMTEGWDDSLLLNNLAWVIVDEPGVENRDLDLAMALSLRSNELSTFSKPAQLDTLARVYFEQGDLSDAIRWQREALKNLDPDDPSAEMLQSTLERYLNDFSNNGK